MWRGNSLQFTGLCKELDKIIEIGFNVFATWSFPFESHAKFSWPKNIFLLKHYSFYNKLI
jgi:hypothetical protein